jgi:hypothetical protein
MNAALVRDHRDCDQNEDDDKHYTLFVRREFDNSKQASHFVVAQLCICGLPGHGFLAPIPEIVILTEAKNLSSFFLEAERTNSQRCLNAWPSCFAFRCSASLNTTEPPISRRELDLLFRLRESL